MNHQPIKALITNQQIAASDQNKNPALPLSGKLDSFDQFYLVHHLAKYSAQDRQCGRWYTERAKPAP